jgi:hypothetical protein
MGIRTNWKGFNGKLGGKRNKPQKQVSYTDVID